MGGNEDDDGNGDDDDDHGHDDDHDHDDDDDHLHVEEFHLLDRDHDEDVIAYVHGDHWDHGPLMVPEGDYVSVGAYVEDDDGHEIELGDGLELEAEEDGNDILEIDSHGDHLHIEGTEEGFSDLIFHLVEDGEVVYETPDGHPLEVEVGDGEQEYTDPDDGHDHDHDDDHDHDHDDDHDHDHDDDHDHDHDDDH
ncbi:hypothetical protein [Natronorubrum halalkaliphilum]|uniref:hypothetical protein n=1 Tax=Natronorubrum halalkaliphilum TaxID=2691917 RepID=UPI002E27C72D|nr:hypothetical protein [Natronorubrum halalkaliphilum]